MQRLAMTGLIAFLIFNGWVSRPASADEANRSALRRFGEEAVYVIEGGRNPPKGYKHSDKYDIDNGIAKNSALADSAYLNRVLLADLLGSNETQFTADLARIGKTLAAGQLMQSGDHLELSTRIPLAIPETSSDTCLGACLVALKKCNPGATAITTPLTQPQRTCLYSEFRQDLDRVIRDMITAKAGNRDLKLWADQPPSGPPAISPYLAIALGTPVSFYSHNPKKPVGYTFDAKRGNAAANKCLDTYNRDTLKLVAGSRNYACSDFDIKILSPDLTYLFLQSVLPPGLLDRYLANAPPSGTTQEQLFETIKDAMSLNKAIVDSGKRHVFKNDVAGGKGVYHKFPALADFVKKWTDAFGREVDIKLEFTFNTPAYVSLPNGPIALIEYKPVPPSIDDFVPEDEDDYDAWLRD